jgi:integrase
VATQRLTKKTITGLPTRPKVYIAYDDSLPGFGCRVTPNGARSWIVEYRPHGGGRGVAKRRITLGPVSTLTPDQAREAARTVLAKVRLGEDVAVDRAARRSAPAVRQLANQFMHDEITPTRKRRTRDLYEMYFRVHIFPELGEKLARDVTRADIAKLHRMIGKKTKVTANRVLMLLSGLYAWAGRAGEVPEGFNPANAITRYREEGRERFLSSDELGRLGDALREAETIGIPWIIDGENPNTKHVPRENRLTKLSPYATAAIRLLLFTGCRLREVLHLRWVDYDAQRSMLFLPDSKTGRKPLVLSRAAIAVIEALPRTGKYVIMEKQDNRPRHDLKRPWDMIRRRAGLGELRLHDLRHSFAATGAASNFGLPVIGKLLGHRRAETTSRYAHLADDPLKTAVDAIAGKLASELGERAPLETGVEHFNCDRMSSKDV